MAVVEIPFRGSILTRGSRGEAVRTWQRQMAFRGWRLAVDGVLGPVTDGVIRSFQYQVGLKVDGRIDGDTWDAAWTVGMS